MADQTPDEFTVKLHACAALAFRTYSIPIPSIIPPPPNTQGLFAVVMENRGFARHLRRSTVLAGVMDGRVMFDPLWVVSTAAVI